MSNPFKRNIGLIKAKLKSNDSDNYYN